MVAQESRRFAFILDTIDESRNQSIGIKVHGNLMKECIGGSGNPIKLDTYDESESRFSATTLKRWRKSSSYSCNLYMCYVYPSTSRCWSVRGIEVLWAPCFKEFTLDMSTNQEVYEINTKLQYINKQNGGSVFIIPMKQSSQQCKSNKKPEILDRKQLAHK